MKIHYFEGFRGAAGPARAMFDYAKVPYEYVAYKPSEFPEHKAKFPFGQMPVMEFDNGEMMCQSNAIMTYAAMKAGVFPEDQTAAAYAFSVTSAFSEASENFKYNVMKADPEKKPENMKKFKEEFCPQYFEKVEKYMQKTGSPGYSVGNSMTFADFFVAEFMDSFTSMMGGSAPFFESETFKAVYETVRKAKEAGKEATDAQKSETSQETNN